MGFAETEPGPGSGSLVQSHFRPQQILTNTIPLYLSFPFCTVVPEDIQAEPGPLGSFQVDEASVLRRIFIYWRLPGKLPTAAAQGSELDIGAGDKASLVSWYVEWTEPV